MRNWKIWDGQFKIYGIKRCILDLELFKPFFTETSLLEFSKHSLSTQCTVSPPHMNLQVVNFQRCKRAFHQCQAWVKLPFALCLLLLTILQLCHLPPPVPPPVSNSSCLFTPCQPLYAAIGSDGKASVYNAGDLGLIPGSGRSAGEGNGNPLQYYYLENPMERSLVGTIHWRRKWQSTPVLLPGKSHGQRSLVGSTGSQRVRHDWATSLSLSYFSRSSIIRLKFVCVCICFYILFV